MPQLLPYYYTYNIAQILVVLIVITLFYSYSILPYLQLIHITILVLI